jgi:hypothetical protein
LSASLKPIYAEIIGKWINLWHEKFKNDWPLELANGLAIGPAIGQAHTSIHFVQVRSLFMQK